MLKHGGNSNVGIQTFLEQALSVVFVQLHLVQYPGIMQNMDAFIS
jgi:hypothetical protein